MHTGQTTERRNERWIMVGCLAQQFNFASCSFDPATTNGSGTISINLHRLQVKIIGNDVIRRLLLHGCCLSKRKLSLKLIGNCFGNLTLNGENVRQIAIVGLGPEVRVASGVD